MKYPGPKFRDVPGCIIGITREIRETREDRGFATLHRPYAPAGVAVGNRA